VKAMTVDGNVKDNWNAIIELAAEIDGSLLARINGLNDFSATTFEDLLPKKRLWNNKAYHVAKGFQENVIHWLMDGILGNQDLMFKLITSLGGYNQFMAGESPGMPMHQLMRMSPEERHRAAKAYGNSLSASVTMRGKPSDKAPVQKIADTKDLGRVWNEVRSSINNNILDSKLVFYDAKKSIKKFKEGDQKGGAEAFWDAGTRATRMVVMGWLATELITALARGINPFADEDTEEEDPIDWTKGPEWFLKKFTDEDTEEVTVGSVAGGVTEIGTGLFINNMPLLRNMAYAEKTGRGITTPLLSGLQVLVKGPQVMAQELGDELNMIEAFEELPKADRRYLLQFMGIAVGGFPVAGSLQLYDYLIDKEYEEIDNANNFVSLEPTVKAIDHFVEKYDESDEEAYRRDKENSEKSELQGVVDQVKEIKEKMVPKPVKKPEVEE
jgi:hypothetical protein